MEVEKELEERKGMRNEVRYTCRRRE